MTEAGRERAFGVAGFATEIVGWIVLGHGSHMILGLALILAGVLLWMGAPAVADTRPGRGVVSLGLDKMSERVQGWDSRENETPDDKRMQRTTPAQAKRPRR